MTKGRKQMTSPPLVDIGGSGGNGNCSSRVPAMARVLSSGAGQQQQQRQGGKKWGRHLCVLMLCVVGVMFFLLNLHATLYLKVLRCLSLPTSK
jgi:hypothetical protein